jgi:uncharacterized membrane protein
MSSEPPKPPQPDSQLPQQSPQIPEHTSDHRVEPARSQQAQQRIQVAIKQETQWSGPIPPPEVLDRLNQVIPGGAERVLKMAEKEQTHRIGIERDGLAASRDDARRGQYLGALISGTAIVGAVVTAVIGSPAIVPIALVGVPVVAIVNAIVNRRSNGKRQ